MLNACRDKKGRVIENGLPEDVLEGLVQCGYKLLMKQLKNIMLKNMKRELQCYDVFLILFL